MFYKRDIQTGTINYIWDKQSTKLLEQLQHPIFISSFLKLTKVTKQKEEEIIKMDDEGMIGTPWMLIQ